MYNRYIRNDNGVYTRIPQEDPHTPKQPLNRAAQDRSAQHEAKGSPAQSGPAPTQSPPFGAEKTSQRPPHTSEGAGHRSDGLTGILRHALDQLHLENVDTGDLLLLVLLFFLFREDADEELLVALGLLLIL